jgi:hypothetical protein
MRRPTPWPAPGESRVHGPLSTDHADEYISRVFLPPDPALREIELELDRIRYEQERDRLARAVEDLARDREETKELIERLKRLQQPQPEPPRPGRPTVLSGDVETLRTLRDEHLGSLCRGEFIATLPKELQKGQRAKRYRDADKVERKERRACDKSDK